MKENNTTFELRKVAEDINNIKISGGDTLDSLTHKFYKILRKHHICKGIKKGNGVTQNNYEYTACFYMFMEKIRSYFDWEDITRENFPRDIYYYS